MAGEVASEVTSEAVGEVEGKVAGEVAVNGGRSQGAAVFYTLAFQ